MQELIKTAIKARVELIEELEAEGTDTWRIFHGVKEGRPGLTIDKYGPQVLIQGFRAPQLTAREISEIKTTLSEHLGFTPHFVYNDRSGKKIINIPLENETDAGASLMCSEMGVRYRVIGAHRGLDPLLFIDLRSARRFLRKHCSGKSLLNLFAYTCGAGVAAAEAGADRVWNVDFAQSNLDYGKENAVLNHIPEKKIRFIHQDVLPVIRQLAGLGVKGKAAKRQYMRFKPGAFDIVLLDPPTWAKSPFGAIDIIRDYQGMFKPALLSVKPGGMLICTNHAAAVDLAEWLELMQRCAVKAGRPLKDIQVIEPESDFPSPDKKFPLKIAALFAQ